MPFCLALNNLAYKIEFYSFLILLFDLFDGLHVFGFVYLVIKQKNRDISYGDRLVRWPNTSLHIVGLRIQR
jgi:hypothetical protein